jgi:hypothetical protein
MNNGEGLNNLNTRIKIYRHNLIKTIQIVNYKFDKIKKCAKIII